jgi:23S rRNA (uracil1939-C5)-methyltransferase
MTKLAPGSELSLSIERLAAGGDGVARHAGRVVFVPLTAPGDVVRVRIREVRPRFARAELLAVITPGLDRRAPPCPLFAQCGGCTWQHLDDAAQSRARIALTDEALTRIGGLAALPPIEHLASPRALGYRASARMAVARGAIGLRARGSHDVIDVAHCPVLDDATQAELTRLRGAAPSPDGEREIRGFGERAAGLRVRPGAFFQPNGALWERFADRVAELCGRGERAVELYAGVGLFTVRLEARFSEVIAVERGEGARDLRENTRARALELSAEEMVKTPGLPDALDLVLMNPPRTGAALSVMHAIATSAPARLVYVSCDPATLARDLRALGDTFTLARVVVIDALPQTHHVEVIAALIRR